jgi:hypothetical protein
MKKRKRINKKYFMKIRKKLKPITCDDCFMIKVCEKYMESDLDNGLCGLLAQAEAIENKWDENYGYDKDL